MSTVSEVVTVEIEIKDAAVSQEGFGTPLILGYHTFWPELVRTFSSPDDMTVAPLSMPTTHPIYLAAQKIMSQNPAPTVFKVGKRAGAPEQLTRLTPSTPTEGEVYSLDIDGETVSVTAGATPTVTSICAALTTAIDDADSAADAVDNTTNVRISGVAGALHRVENVSRNLAVTDLTEDPATGIATDLAAVRAYDADWYWLVLADGNSEAQILAAAAWVETQRIMMGVTPSDGETWDGAVTDDVGSELKTAGYHRTFSLYHEKPASQFASAAWVGRIGPKAPGSYTAANKSLAGVDKSVLDDTQRATLKGKNVNYYVDVKGIGFTLDGRAASGRYIDITHGIDWFEARTEERIIFVQANNDKVPYTDKGVSLFVAQVEAQILEGITIGLIDGDSPWSVSAPKVKDVNPNDKTQRLLPDLKFDFVLQGAIHKVQIRGTVRTAAA